MVITCFYYDKEGHIKRDCPKRKKDLARDEAELEETNVIESDISNDALTVCSVTEVRVSMVLGYFILVVISHVPLEIPLTPMSLVRICFHGEQC